MKKLVLFPSVDDARLALIRAAAGSMHVVNADDDQCAVDEIRDADAFFGKLTPALLAEAEQLRWVQSPTASLEHYLFPALVAHPCVLTNMRGLFFDVIADHVLGFVLCFARNLHRYVRQQSRREWSPVGGESARTSFTVGPGEVSDIDRSHIHLADCTLGVVGLGSIGAEVARRAAAFGMRVIGVDVRTETTCEFVEQVRPPDLLNQLLEQSDFVVIAAPHTPATEKMFQRAQFEQMKTSAYLINVGRGIIVDLQDLTAALRAGEIAGAALDVFEEEPLPTEHPLWEMENVIITPHVAAASVRVPERHTQTLLENIRRFAAEEPLLNIVDKQQWF